MKEPFVIFLKRFTLLVMVKSLPLPVLKYRLLEHKLLLLHKVIWNSDMSPIIIVMSPANHAQYFVACFSRQQDWLGQMIKNLPVDSALWSDWQFSTFYLCHDNPILGCVYT